METTLNIQVLRPQLEKYQRDLNQEPPQSDIVIDTRYKLERTGPDGQKFYVQPRYMPISFVQTKLDEIFYGLWETKIDHVQVIANEIIGHGRLILTHPVTGTKIERTGAAAVMVQFKSGSQDITDVNNKIKNTLVKDYPHLLAEITKSAARTLGKVFGRDLNREFTDTYVPQSIEGESADEIRRHLQGILDIGALPTALHTFIDANLSIATFNQLCQMKEKADAEIRKQIEAPVNTPAA